MSVKPVDGRLNLRLARSSNPVAPQQTAKLRLPWNEEMTANVGLGQWGDNLIPVPEDFRSEDVQITWKWTRSSRRCGTRRRTTIANWA